MPHILRTIAHQPRLRVYFIVLGMLLATAVSHGAAGEPRVLKNPYEGVAWDNINQYKANFHSHTVKSDGRAEPDVLIRAYAEAGYDVLAITDHDNYYRHREGERNIIERYVHTDGRDRVPTAETTWPWTRWIDEEPSTIWVYNGRETSAFYPGLGERGMLAVRGAELTTHPHVISLFNMCGWPDRNHTEQERLDCVEHSGGIAYWAHPMDYVPGGRWEHVVVEGDWEEAVEYFGRYISEYDSLLGLELQFRGDRRDRGLELLDRLTQRYMPEHTVLIISSDDNHGTRVPDDAAMTVILAEELTEPAIRRALENGHNFAGTRTPTPPTFKRIVVDEQAKTITLDIDPYERIRWFSNGEEHATGPLLDYSQMDDAVVRFEVEQSGAIFYSQVFYIGRE